MRIESRKMMKIQQQQSNGNTNNEQLQHTTNLRHNVNTKAIVFDIARALAEHAVASVCWRFVVCNSIPAYFMFCFPIFDCAYCVMGVESCKFWKCFLYVPATRHNRFLNLNLLFCCYLASEYGNCGIKPDRPTHFHMQYYFISVCNSLMMLHCVLYRLPANVWFQWHTKRLNRQLNSIRFRWWMSRSKLIPSTGSLLRRF